MLRLMTFSEEKCSHPNPFKVGISPSKKNCVICLIKSPLKMMKNVFYLILKDLFSFSSYLSFCHDVLVM